MSTSRQTKPQSSFRDLILLAESAFDVTAAGMGVSYRHVAMRAWPSSTSLIRSRVPSVVPNGSVSGSK